MLIKSMILALVGFMLSLYSYTIEQKIKQDQQYKPFCDLADRISCSKPILSEYGKIFGITNSLLGMLFYALVALSALLGFKAALFWLACAACGASVVFAFILITKVQVFCAICFSIYLVNALLLWVNWRG